MSHIAVLSPAHDLQSKNVNALQGRSDGGNGVYRYMYPQNQSTLNILCGCSSHVTQDRFDMI